jgi:transposase
MKLSIHLPVWLLLAASAALAMGQRSAYDPAARDQRKPREGFIDFVLKQINPENTDYGCKIEEARKLTVDETVKNIDFWAVLVALNLLILSFFMLRAQQRERNRLEVVAARFLAQYHNAWVDACTRAEQVIRRYNELANATGRAAETALLHQSPDAEPAQTAMLNGDTNLAVRQKSAAAGVAKNMVTRNEADASDSLPSKSSSRRHDQSEADFIAQIKTLQHQLTASHERENNLRRELSKVQHRAQAGLTGSA